MTTDASYDNPVVFPYKVIVCVCMTFYHFHSNLVGIFIYTLSFVTKPLKCFWPDRKRPSHRLLQYIFSHQSAIELLQCECVWVESEGDRSSEGGSEGGGPLVK